MVGVSSAGKPLSRRLVVMCQPFDFGGAFDPDSLTTAAYDLRLLTIDPVIPDAHGTRDSTSTVTATEHAGLILEYMQDVLNTARQISGPDYERIGVIGWGTGAITVTELLATKPAIVDRVALIQPGTSVDPGGRPGSDDAAVGLQGRVERGLQERHLITAPPLSATQTRRIEIGQVAQLPDDAVLHINQPTSAPLEALTTNWSAILEHVERRGEQSD